MAPCLCQGWGQAKLVTAVAGAAVFATYKLTKWATPHVKTAAKYIASSIKSDKGEIAIGKTYTETVYRGVAYGHPGYNNALNGVAKPIGGHSNPVEHARGNTESNFTSWTTDRSIAKDFADNGNGVGEGNGPGVILEMNLSRIPDKRIVDNRKGIHQEEEILISGEISNAKVNRFEDHRTW